jgi:hypothetical protein
MTRDKHLHAQNLCAGFAALWGVWAAWPNAEMFARIPQLYAPMLDLVPSEAFWGVLMIAIGISCVILSYIGQRGIAAIVLGFTFMLFGLLYAQGDFQSPGGVLWGWVGFYNILYFLAGLRWFK